LNPAHNYFEYQISNVKPNAPVVTIPVPDAIRAAMTPPTNVESEELGDGVWLLGGQSHHSLLVEFRDYVAIVEAPNNEARSLAVLAEAKRLVPDKHVQYVVNTHHHFDHAGGLRTYLSQGTTIVTHESNKQYYLDILFHPAPRTLQPDRMSQFNPMYWISRRPAPIETVSGEARGTGRYAITDGEQILEVFHVQDMYYELGDRSMRYGHHSEDMLMVYLPRERILVNADLYTVRGQVPNEPSLGIQTLYENIKKLNLDVERHVPIHGRISTHEEFMSMFE
jgi:glyoxylase-like metal-dependent hydrolase (beta-lactamase superfamily II)